MNDDEFVHRIEAAVNVLRHDTSANPFKDDAIDKLEALLALYRDYAPCPACGGRGIVPKQQST